jgi:hypothetical protein
MEASPDYLLLDAGIGEPAAQGRAVGGAAKVEIAPQGEKRGHAVESPAVDVCPSQLTGDLTRGGRLARSGRPVDRDDR